MLEDIKSGYRAKIILLKDESTAPQIRKITNHHDNNIKWVHRLKKGLMALYQKNIVINNKFDDIEKKIVDITSSNPILWFRIFYMVITCSCGFYYV